jgi:hypothetical protein
MAAATINLYNHTRKRFLSGENLEGDTYKVNLYTSLPTNYTATTKAEAEVGATQISTANGYIQDDMVLTGIINTIVSTSNGKFDADDVIWTPTGGSIEADYGMVWNETDDAPLLRLVFSSTVTAPDGIPFVIGWDPSGIFTLS